MRPPSFWRHGGGFVPRMLLTPLSWLQTFAVRRRLGKPGYKASIPVVCVGNAVMGGSGKTPCAIAIAKLLRDNGHKPAFLTRGYGGDTRGPVCVDTDGASAADVGDEALLLAHAFPTWVSRDRAAGARAIEADNRSTVIVMDDGFQNPSLQKDFSILVTDGTFGLGNEAVFPAGPLREPWADALVRADAQLIVGPDRRGLVKAAALPVFQATLEPRPAVSLKAGTPVIAFAGIGLPEKFFETARSLGLDLVESVAFADHHPYSHTEIAGLRERAEAAGAKLLTTEKDWVRLSTSDRRDIAALPVTLSFVEHERFLALLLSRVTA